MLILEFLFLLVMSLYCLLFGLYFAFLFFYHNLDNTELLFLHIINVYNHIFLLLFLLLNVDFLRWSFGLLILQVKVHLFFEHLVFPLTLGIVLHMMISFLHIFFGLLHIMYQMLGLIFLNLIILLSLLIYLLVFLNLYFLNYVLLLLL